MYNDYKMSGHIKHFQNLQVFFIFLMSVFSFLILINLSHSGKVFADALPSGCYMGTLATTCPQTDSQGNAPLDSGGNATDYANNCYQLQNGTIDLVDCNNVTGPTIQSASPSTNPAPTCLNGGGNNNTAWLLCEIIDGTTNAEGAAENVVISLLKTPPVAISGANCKAGSTASQQDQASACIYNVWSSFRIYGNILLVISLLIAIIVEAIGGGLISAYTIRKMLPRILVAVVLINLSIYIVAALEDVFNILGGGVYDLIKAPFSQNNLWKLNITGPSDTTVFLGMFAGLGLLLGGIALGGLYRSLKGTGSSAVPATGTSTAVRGGKPSILSGLGDAALYLIIFVVLPILLAILGVLLTLLFRQAVLILLLMISPVAFSLYCLPNTETYFKKWWGILIKTLAVYPIVVALLCMAEVMSIVFNANPFGLEDFLAKFIAIIAVCAPLFLIPFAFKLSGGVVGSVSGGLSNLRKRGNAAIKGNPNDPNSRGNRVKKRNKYQRERFGLSAGSLATRTRGAFRGQGRTAAAARKSGFDTQWANEELSKNRNWQANNKNDDYLWALQDMDHARSERAAAVASGDSSRVAAWDSAIAAARSTPRTRGTMQAAAQQLAENGSGFAEGVEGHNQMMRNSARASGSNVTVDSAGNVNGFSGPNAGTAQQFMRNNKKAVTPSRADLGNHDSTQYNPSEAWNKLDHKEMAAQRPEALRSVHDDLVRRINSGSGSQQDFENYARHKVELNEMATGGKVNPALATAAQELIDASAPLPGGVAGPPSPGASADSHYTGWAATNGAADTAAQGRARQPLP